MKFENKDQLRQSLLEFHYGLLEDDEAEWLRAAIGSDPQVAAEWATTLRLAGKLADAAKIEGAQLPKVKLSEVTGLAGAQPSRNGSGSCDAPPMVAQMAQVEPTANKVVEDADTVRRRSNWRLWIGSTGLAATAAAIGMLVIGSWYVERIPEAPMAVVRLQAEPVPVHAADRSDNEFRFVTSRWDASSSSMGQFPLTPATLSFSVLARNTVLFSGKTQTDSDGSGSITLPPELVIPNEAKLRVTAKSVDGQASESTIEVPLEPTRCLTYLTVDRPVYRPGETVYFRSLTLRRRSLRANSDVPLRFELVDPSGAVVSGAFSEGVTERGVGNGAFTIPSAAPGGPYTLVAKSLDGSFPEERCEFQVRAYRVPRFKKELEFRKRSYGAGETVEADFSAVRAEGGPLAGAAVRVTATVDDKLIHRSTTSTSPTGTCLVSFRLPTFIDRGRGQLSIAIDDGGTQETKSKTIPIQLGRVAVDFYPEGGYLVEGLVNRVYFTAHDSLDEPIDIAGEILSRSGESVATIQTERDGMGRFELVPVHGERYTLKVTRPVDVSNSPKLPSVVKDLPVLDTGVGVFDAWQPISMVIRTSRARAAVVRAVCRGRLVGQQAIHLRQGDNPVSLPVPDDVGGVVRVTLLDATTAATRPLVERLVYRRCENQLQVEVVAGESALQRSPGEPMRLTLQVRDATGEPTPAVLGVSVVDDAARSLDDTERPQLRTHFLLTSEVEKPEDLEHANFYLSEGPEAAQSLDLLLGTQGWRRFVSGTSSIGDVDFREQLIRLLELDGNASASVTKRFDNAGTYASQWLHYRATAEYAWHRLLREARILMLAVLALWLMSILLHLRRQAKCGMAVWLLVTSTSLLIYGCGAGQEAMVIEADARAKTSSAREGIRQQAADMNAYEAEAGDASAEDASMPLAPSPLAAGIEKKPEPSSGAIQSDPAAVARDFDDALYGEDAPTRFVTPARRLADAARSISKQDLQRLLAARGLDAQALADQLLDELRFPIRQYAHRHRSSDSEIRQDFAETLYWQPLLITDSQGRATVRFDLSDSVTTFRVNVDGHSTDGRIGSGGGNITSRLPFQIEPKLPLEVTTGDRIDLPIAVINATDSMARVQLSLTADRSLQPIGDTTAVVELSAGDRRREHVTLDVVSGSAEQDATIEIRGVGPGSLADSVQRSLHISPAGYPARQSIAGRLTGRAAIELPIPEDIVPGSLAVTVRAYPSPIADVMSGVESILREPHGCFEQTSATNYPNTMALLYLKESQAANPQVTRRALGMLDRGYQKLVSFECENLGYEWFGADPGHEALSALGLMQFTDMSKVMEVSEEMLVRTRQWLLGRRDGQGGFHRNPRHLHVWSVEQQIVNAYVVWAITEADVAAGQPLLAATELASELDQLNRVAKESDDPYLLSLSAAALMNVKRLDDGELLLKRLARMQNKDGSLQGKTTVTSSGGLSLKMETTALGTIAWVKSPRFIPQAQAGAKWIAGNRLGNAGFGSTQATVLALKALLATGGYSTSQAGGSLQVRYEGELIGQAKLPDQPWSGSTVEIQGLGGHLQAAERDIEIELMASQAKDLSYTIDISYHALTPESDDACPVELSTRFSGAISDRGSIPSGETLKVEARLRNRTTEGQPMTVAIVGLPGGVEPRVEELDELQQAGQFDFYEIIGREVVLYWRTMEPGAVKQVDFHVTATIPGRYTGPASRAYLYYTAEQKHWTEPLSLGIDR